MEVGNKLEVNENSYLIKDPLLHMISKLCIRIFVRRSMVKVLVRVRHLMNTVY
jgi:hypothetical protein